MLGNDLSKLSRSSLLFLQLICRYMVTGDKLEDLKGRFVDLGNYELAYARTVDGKKLVLEHLKLLESSKWTNNPTVVIPPLYTIARQQTQFVLEAREERPPYPIRVEGFEGKQFVTVRIETKFPSATVMSSPYGLIAPVATFFPEDPILDSLILEGEQKFHESKTLDQFTRWVGTRVKPGDGSIYEFPEGGLLDFKPLHYPLGELFMHHGPVCAQYVALEFAILYSIGANPTPVCFQESIAEKLFPRGKGRPHNHALLEQEIDNEHVILDPTGNFGYANSKEAYTPLLERRGIEVPDNGPFVDLKFEFFTPKK
ncbi:MAG: hypothetical protein V1837_02935 [Candidatus Woesearchaeota archaeon]